MTTAPALFLSHGSPMVALADDDYTATLASIPARFGSPRAILVVSAHHLAPRPFRVGAAARPETIHDFGGFPPELDGLGYPASGDPTLAADVLARLGAAGLDARLDPGRGLDHGAWVPLRHAFPEAGIPVVPLSLPWPSDPAELALAGRALAPLRDDGVLLLGSGGMVHNLRRVRFDDERAPVEGWADDFDRWARERFAARDAEALADFRRQGPSGAIAHPSTDHFDPIFFVLGAARDGDRPLELYAGFRHATLSMWCGGFEG